MVDRVDAPQQVGDKFAVADVALVEVDVAVEVRPCPARVNGRSQSVEDDDVVALCEETVAGVRSDESRAAGDEDPHCFRWRRRSATSRYTSNVEAATALQVNSAARRNPASRCRSESAVASMIARAIESGLLGSAEQRRTARDLRHRAARRRHDGAAAGHCLEDGQSKRLVERRIHEDVRGPVEVDRLFERDATDEDDIVADAQFSRPARRARRRTSSSRARTDDHELAVTELATGARPRAQQSVTILVPPQ